MSRGEYYPDPSQGPVEPDDGVNEIWMNMQRNRQAQRAQQSIPPRQSALHETSQHHIPRLPQGVIRPLYYEQQQSGLVVRKGWDQPAITPDAYMEDEDVYYVDSSLVENGDQTTGTAEAAYDGPRVGRRIVAIAAGSLILGLAAWGVKSALFPDKHDNILVQWGTGQSPQTTATANTKFAPGETEFIKKMHDGASWYDNQRRYIVLDGLRGSSIDMGYGCLLTVWGMLYMLHFGGKDGTKIVAAHTQFDDGSANDFNNGNYIADPGKWNMPRNPLIPLVREEIPHGNPRGAIIEQLDQGRPVIIYIYAAAGDHWVVANKHDGNEVFINDPWPYNGHDVRFQGSDRHEDYEYDMVRGLYIVHTV